MGTTKVDAKFVFTLQILCQILLSSSFNSVVPGIFRRAGQKKTQSGKLSFHKGKGRFIPETCMSALSDFEGRDHVHAEMWWDQCLQETSLLSPEPPSITTEQIIEWKFSTSDLGFNLWHLSDNSSKDIYAILEQQLLCLSCHKTVWIPHEIKNHHSSTTVLSGSVSLTK